MFGTAAMSILGMAVLQRSATELMRGQRKAVLDDSRGGTFRHCDAPFGYELGDDGCLVELPSKQAAIETIRMLRVQGLSYRAIADALATSGVSLSHVVPARRSMEERAPASVRREGSSTEEAAPSTPPGSRW